MTDTELWARINQLTRKAKGVNGTSGGLTTAERAELTALEADADARLRYDAGQHAWPYPGQDNERRRS